MRRAKIGENFFSSARFVHSGSNAPAACVSPSDVVLRAMRRFATAAGDPTLRSTIVLLIRRGDISSSTVSSYPVWREHIPALYTSTAAAVKTRGGTTFHNSHRSCYRRTCCYISL